MKAYATAEFAKHAASVRDKRGKPTLSDSRSGKRTISPFSMIPANDGDSVTRRRITRPIATRTKLSRNGIRPTPRSECRVRHHGVGRQEDAVGENQSGGCAHLRETCVQILLPCRRVLHRHECRTGAFTAQTDALNDAHRHQEDGRPETDGVVVRDEADECGPRRPSSPMRPRAWPCARSGHRSARTRVHPPAVQ